jgi:predicted transcriptional regulator
MGKLLQDVLQAALKRWLSERGMSQSELGRHLGITQSSVSRWLSGEQPVPVWLPYALQGLGGALKGARERLESEKVWKQRKKLSKKGERVLVRKPFFSINAEEMIEGDHIVHILDMLNYDVYELLNIPPEDADNP